MNTEFPQGKAGNKFIKADAFQDRPLTLTYQGWEKKGNNGEDWKDKLDFNLKYSYPQFALDKAGQQQIGRDGKPMENSNYDPDFPHGYSVNYIFNEGTINSGSLPLFREFCRVNPKPGDSLSLLRTGQGVKTTYSISKVEKGLFPRKDISSGTTATFYQDKPTSDVAHLF